MTTDSADRWTQGIATYKAVYGEGAVAFPRGQVPMFDLMIEQLFAEIWSRTALAIPQRRLLAIGVLAAQGKFDVITLQFERALRTGELTVEQVREVVIHLVAYVGYPSSSDLLRVSESAIASVAASAGGAAE